MDPHPDLCVALNNADLAAIVQVVIQEARKQGTPITPYTADHIAAARMFGLDTVYAGSDRNVPRPGRSGQRVLGIRWLLLS